MGTMKREIALSTLSLSSQHMSMSGCVTELGDNAFSVSDFKLIKYKNLLHESGDMAL